MSHQLNHHRTAADRTADRPTGWSARLFLCLAVAMVLALAACSGGGQSSASETDQDGAEAGVDGDGTGDNTEDETGADTANDAGAAGSRSSGDSTEVEVPDPSVVIDYEPEFVVGQCDYPIPPGFEVECGTVAVPEDWQTGDGAVELAVAVFASTAEEPAPDPVVYLEGGPGGHALETLVYGGLDLYSALLERGDVVVFDQRGAGRSEPELGCQEVTEVVRELEDIAIIEDEEAEARYLDALAECRDRLEGEGVDLRDYNSFNNAHDVEALRQALGYDQWNLLGISYGTRLGLEVLRQHPDGVRSVVLDSVYPPEVDSAAENPQSFIDSYERVVAACAAEPECGDEGDLAQRFEELVSQFQVEPVQVTVQDFVNGTSDEMYLTGDALIGVITQALYSPAWFSDLPELAADLESGRTTVVEQFLSQQRSTEQFFSDGMFYAVTCHEEIAYSDPDSVVDPPDPFGLRETFDLASNTGTNAFETCEAFANGRAAPVANEPVVSDVPTLLLAGEFDPVTPVSWAETAADDLSNSFLVVSESASHGLTGSECVTGIVLAFLDDPSSEPETGCLAEESVEFLARAPVNVEMVEATYSQPQAGVEITTLRPESWMVGSLGGDQYRQQSFLDPTQLLQIAGDQAMGFALSVYVNEANDLSLSATEPFEGGDSIGSLRAADLPGDWSRRSADSSEVVVEWLQTSRNDVTLYVVLIAPRAESDELIEQVLKPAAQAIAAEAP